jgi:hypothetical protein
MPQSPVMSRQCGVGPLQTIVKASIVVKKSGFFVVKSTFLPAKTELGGKWLNQNFCAGLIAPFG